MADITFCFSCGEDLVEKANFCHSCAQDLSKISNKGSSSNEDEGNDGDMYEGIGLVKDDLDLDDISLHSKDKKGEELLDMWREAIADALEEQDVTVEDIGNEDMFNYLMVDEIMKRSTKIILEKEDSEFNYSKMKEEEMEN